MVQNPENQPSTNTLLDYHRVDVKVRIRAKQLKLEYAAKVSQASWLRLDLDGAVLLTPTEFSQLPHLSREFFLDGNTSHYRNDRVAMRGKHTILLDGYYSGGPKDEMRVDYFLEVAQRYQKAVPEVLKELSDDKEEQWKAKLAVWDNLINLSAAQFHALKAITLLHNYSTEERDSITNKSQQFMSDMFEGYFSTLCGRPTYHLVARCSDDILDMMDLVTSHKEELKKWGEYDLFRTEREVVSAEAFMAAYSWVRDGLLDDAEVVISPLIGSIDVIESLRFIAKFREELDLSNHKLPQKYMYILSKIAPIGRSSRSMEEREGVILLYHSQSSEIESLPKNTAVVFVDETVSTGASLRELKAFVSQHNEVEERRTLAVSLGTRWAVNDTAPAQELGNLKAVGFSPTMRIFKGKYLEVETLLSRYRVRQRLDVSRRVENTDQILDALRSADYWKSIDGVGFDLFGTLIDDDSYDRETRRHELHAKFLEKIGELDSQVNESQFNEVYWNTRAKLEILAQRSEGIHAEFKDLDLWSSVLSVVGVSDAEERARDLLIIELDYEIKKYSAVSGMLQVVKEAVTIFGSNHVGVFSNSRLPSEVVSKLLDNYGFIGEENGMLKPDNVFTSSGLGVRKPDAITLLYLSERLGVLTKRLMFIGDSKEDMQAALRTKSIGVQLMRKNKF